MKRGILFLLAIIFIVGCFQIEEEIYEAPYEETTQPLVYFCPRDDCNQILVDFIDSAEHSIHCAFFDIDLDEVIDTLDEKNKLVEVQVVVDNDNKLENNYGFIKYETSSRYSHNKFCIIDNKRISTGSFNPTERGAFKNNNNLIIVESEYLVKNFEDEFNELWNGVYGKGNNVKYPYVFLNNKKYENYFCPEDNCAYQVKKAINNSKYSIYFMTFSFTHGGIATDLILKHEQGVTIKGIFEKMQAGSKYSKFNLLDFQGIEVKKDNNSANMHHKVFIIDNQTVITGSFNPSKNADENNDENILIIHDKAVAERYLEEFEFLWGE